MNAAALIQGVQAPAMAALVIRVTVGPFFVASGAHKLLNRQRRASLAQTFKADGVYSPAIMWAIPLGELAGGLGVLAGCLTIFAAAGLILICGGATAFDGLRRIPAMQPLDVADAADDVLYLPEVLYVVMLLALVLIGPGPLSVDAYLFG